MQTYKSFRDSGLERKLTDKLHEYRKTYSPRKKHALVVNRNQLPLSANSSNFLQDKVTADTYMFAAMRAEFEQSVEGNGNLFVKRSSCKAQEVIGLCATRIRRWTLDFIWNEGYFTTVSYQHRKGYSIIQNEYERQIMEQYMLRATRSKPPATASDFRDFVNCTFDSNICESIAQLWLLDIGFRFRKTKALQVCKDGHTRPDVILRLNEYIAGMETCFMNLVAFTGLDCSSPVSGKNLENGGRKIVISYHDEACCSANDRKNCTWQHNEKGGKLSDKDSGSMVMVAGFICSEVGL